MLHATAYYTNVRDDETVNAAVDTAIIRLIVDGTSAEDINALQQCFFEWFRIPNSSPRDTPKLPKDDKSAGLKALLIFLSLALQNVQDVNGDPNIELGPFIDRVIKDDYFRNSMQLFAIIVFGVAVTEVSISNYAVCCLC